MAAQLLLQHVKTPSGACADILVDAGRIVQMRARSASVLTRTPAWMPKGTWRHPVSSTPISIRHRHLWAARGSDYDYADTVPGRAKTEAEYLAKHGRMNSLRNCYVQFRGAIRRGTTHVRGHIDVGVFGLAELEDAARAREAFRDVLDIEYVRHALKRHPEHEDRSRTDHCRGPARGSLQYRRGRPLRPGPRSRALRGADPASGRRTRRQKVDLHLHEFGSMGLFSLDLLFKKIREYDLRDRVTISHAWCLANLPDTRYQPIAEAFQELGIGIITHVPGHVPFPSLKQARRWQVRYGVGTDNMRNLWGPYGMNDMRERVMLLAYLSDFRRREDLELAYDAGTYGSASVLGLPDYGLSEGYWADLVVFPVENRACALLEGPMPRFVIKRGVLVARDGELTDAVPPCPE